MLEKENIQSRGFRNVSLGGKVIGFQVPFRSSYYRGVWLSQLTEPKVVVDGEVFEGDQITWTISGNTYAHADLSKYSEVNWPLYEPAILTIKKPGGLKHGIHNVDLSYGYSNSYTAAASRSNWIVSQNFTRKMSLVR
jgi:hypothetical protein